MNEHDKGRPLTKEERERLCRESGAFLDYEATVKALEDELNTMRQDMARVVEAKILNARPATEGASLGDVMGSRSAKEHDREIIDRWQQMVRTMSDELVEAGKLIAELRDENVRLRIDARLGHLVRRMPPACRLYHSRNLMWYAESIKITDEGREVWRFDDRGDSVDAVMEAAMTTILATDDAVVSESGESAQP